MRAAGAGLTLQLAKDVAAHLAARGYDPAVGARLLRRTVTEELEDALSDRLLTGELRRGDHVRVFVEEGRLSFQRDSEATKEAGQG